MPETCKTPSLSSVSPLLKVLLPEEAFPIYPSFNSLPPSPSQIPIRALGLTKKPSLSLLYDLKYWNWLIPAKYGTNGSFKVRRILGLVSLS